MYSSSIWFVFSASLLLCTKTSRERNDNTGALNVSAATFLLGSNSFQRNDTCTSVCFFFLSWLPRGYCCRETSSARKCKPTSPTFCHCLCMLCCLLVTLLCVFTFFSFFPPKEASGKFRGAGTGWRGAGQGNPGFRRGTRLCWGCCFRV